MKSLLAFGVLFFVLSFCGITDKISQQIKEKTDDIASTKKSDDDKPADVPAKKDGEVEKAELSPEQMKILDDGKEAKWAEQGITWTVPDGWSKMSVNKTMLNYGSPKTGFLIGTISTMPANFPSETSLDATYSSSLEQLKNGKYEMVRWLEIDGIKGVEWVESMPEDKGDPRRHQWIGFRNYQGNNQQLNIMVLTKGSAFDDKKAEYSAILYSTKIDK